MKMVEPTKFMMEQLYDRLTVYLAIKVDVILSIMCKINDYYCYNDRTLLNLSFRQGDILHSLWDDCEEEVILPILVELGLKPVASIVIQDDNDDNDIIVSNCCRKLIITNKWGVKVMLICKNDSYTDEELIDLANETNDFTTRGIMYGYN